MTEYQLSVDQFYMSISDHDLDAIISRIQAQFPTCGNRQMQGHLFSQWIRVQQHRDRESQHCVDPQGCIMRRLSVTRQQQYHHDPGTLWHIDGNQLLLQMAYGDSWTS